MAEKQKKSGGGRKLGRNEKKCQKYKTEKTKAKNKVKRVLKSSGVTAAQEYAEKNEVYGYFKKLLNK